MSEMNTCTVIIDVANNTCGAPGVTTFTHLGDTFTECATHAQPGVVNEHARPFDPFDGINGEAMAPRRVCVNTHRMTTTTKRTITPKENNDMTITHTRTGRTIPGPWGSMYRIDSNTIVANVAQAIADEIVRNAQPHRKAIADALATVTVDTCKTAWTNHANTYRDDSHRPARRLNIFGFWVRLIDAEPLDGDEWDRVVALLKRQVEWEDTLDGDAPLGDLFDGQL